MKPALLIVDIQNDFLRSPGLTPVAEELIERTTKLLDGCRQAAVPIVHVWTTVHLGEDRRMPHWVHAGKWICVAGTEGHATPAQLRPRPEEQVVHKTFFSGFHATELARLLSTMGCDAVVIAGLHEHACIRTTAIDAYQAGLKVWMAADAVASNDPVHAAITRRYLCGRVAYYECVEMLLHRINMKRNPLLFGAAGPNRDVSANLLYRGLGASENLGEIVPLPFCHRG